jgi:flagellar protein FlaH
MGLHGYTIKPNLIDYACDYDVALTLIEGDSHSGKSVLAQQMTRGSLHDGFQLSFFTTENTVKSLVKQMQSLDIDILNYLLLNQLRLYPMEFAQTKGDILGALLDAVTAERQQGRGMVFIDALTPCINVSQHEAVLGFFERCKRLCSDGMTILIVVHSHAISKDFLVRVTSLCDAHLRMRTEEVGNKLVKTMEVSKVRGASKNTGNIVSFEIEPGLGMRIIPINRAQG